MLVARMPVRPVHNCHGTLDLLRYCERIPQNTY